MKEQNNIKILFEKYLVNASTAEEVEALIDSANGDNREELEDLLLQEFEKLDLSNETNPALRKEIFDSIRLKISTERGVSKAIRFWTRVLVSAIVLFLLCFSFYLITNKKSVESSVDAVVNEVVPGQDGATLTLANGEKIVLNKEFTGELALESGVTISKTAEGQIVYKIKDDSKDVVGYNTLSTTRGEQFQIVLPDGSTVYLNSESSLIYPSKFAKTKDREVELLGEGYFEIVKSKDAPFVVNVKGQKIKVLGTAFNIQAYPENKLIKTTLSQGVVEVSNNKEELTLKPGEQAISSNQNMEKRKVDVEEFMAWKNGEFAFNEDNLEHIMRRVSRWYDVEVVFRGGDPKLRFAGKISRKVPLETLLESLELTGKVSFELKERRLYVNP